MKNKTQKSIISIFLVLALVVGCFATIAPTVNAASSPVQGNPDWDAKYKTATAIEPSFGPAMDLENNPRTDASGDKISSNAHSADFPGLYFYWDDKQKDNGVLLVLPEVFDLFVEGEFTLTAKNSNNYWGYTISPATGKAYYKDAAMQVVYVYAYGIAKQIKYNEIGNNGKVSAKTDDLKNINMVFIDGNYKSAYFEIVKNWYDEEGVQIDCQTQIDELNTLLNFNNGYTLGRNEVKITDFKTASNGKSITVKENIPAGYFEQDGKSTQTITVKYDKESVVKFDNQRQYAQINVVKMWVNESGETIDAPDGIVARLTNDWAFMEYGTVKAGTEISFTEKNIKNSRTVTDWEERARTLPGEDDWSSWQHHATRVENGITYITERRSATEIIHQFKTITTTSYVLDSVSINGVVQADNKVDFVAEAGMTYDIIFTNKVVITTKICERDVPIEVYEYREVEQKEPSFKVIGDKIESEAHVGKWWAEGYGVIALAGSSITGHNDDGSYAVGISESGFEQFGGTVYVGYGSDETALDTIIAFNVDGSYEVIRGQVEGMSVVMAPDANMYVKSPPHGINGELEFEALFIFDNVFGSGARHAYLLEYTA